MTIQEIERLVFQAIRNLNSARKPEAQLEIASDAPLFAAESGLDSLGLVALLIDIEEAFRDQGSDVSLSDDHAMSQSRSPFRSVSTLVSYIDQRLVRTP